jgi:hypothetical protein
MSDFVICINNESNPASLILGKVYRTLSEARNMLRVIDEDKSELDGYLYPASMFAPIELPEEARRALTAGNLSQPITYRGQRTILFIGRDKKFSDPDISPIFPISPYLR